ncbi:lysylphosphatidylglycerol synthase domain-containing protein [Streptococcus didelphis]|uniref:lysylphosphatidylglycerol synthase domain-containing protein n=1 Tax=Streptococcus didelphis TaxID=102886 RepID=UPI0027D34BFE|nr:lysylphosphatidylglycerol synthase domain-containing protein [Streptococcus didelphis]WMB30093.1 lysylphosphatidylglycerol synthase domain-containing protein [Streptococcus didelphis]
MAPSVSNRLLFTFYLNNFQSKEIALFWAIRKSSIVTLLASSFLEWLGVWIVFVSIGSLMGIHLPILSVFPILVIAHSVGILSMIPGGIGSFDLMMMTGLTGLGLQSTQVIAWILLFRLFYYILPFL